MQINTSKTIIIQSLLQSLLTWPSQAACLLILFEYGFVPLLVCNLDCWFPRCYSVYCLSIKIQHVNIQPDPLHELILHLNGPLALWQRPGLYIVRQFVSFLLHFSHYDWRPETYKLGFELFFSYRRLDSCFIQHGFYSTLAVAELS